jgi:hypothetical protein
MLQLFMHRFSFSDTYNGEGQVQVCIHASFVAVSNTPAESGSLELCYIHPQAYPDEH